MPDDTPNWSVNPFAVAELITGEELSGKKEDWVHVTDVLENAFKTKLEAIFKGAGGTPPFELFQELARSSGAPSGLAKDKQTELVRRAIELYGEPSMARILPYLVPDADAIFASPGAQAAVEYPPVAGSWSDIDTDEKVVGGISYLDAEQGFAQDCYLISAMIALAWSHPAEWVKRMRQTITIDHSSASKRYSYTFHGDGETNDQPVEIKPRLLLNELNKFAYARSTNAAAEGWPGMLEKAFVMRQRKLLSGNPVSGGSDLTRSDYAKINRKYAPHDACRILVGGVMNQGYPNSTAPPFKPIQTQFGLAVDGRGVTTKPTMVWTGLEMNGAGFSKTGLHELHAYAVLGLKKWGHEDYVVLRDPWGITYKGTESQPAETWKPGPGPNGADEVALGKKGVFALRAHWFYKAFMEVDWVA